MNAQDLYKKAFAKIRKMSKAEAIEWVEDYAKIKATIDRPAIRELTGGYASQSLNAVIVSAVGRKAFRNTNPTLKNMGV